MGVSNAGYEKGRSPFSPGRPVPLELFVGREEQVTRILRSAEQVSLGKQENLFVTGEYGIGKSSLVSFARAVAEDKCGIAGFHVFLGGISTIEEMAQQVVARVLQQTHRNKVFDRVKGFLGKYVESVELFAVKVNLQALRDDARDIAQGFLPFLRRLWNSLKEDRKGIALYLDDLNGLTKAPEFAALIKSLVDEIATSREPLPLLLVLAGISERRLEILENQPSVERIFDIVEISPLPETDVRSFYRQAFASANMSIDDEALHMLILFSGGLPKLMHELGDAVFWVDSDQTVDLSDAVLGVVQAADIVGRKYFDPVRKALRSSDYHSILKKLGALELRLTFSKSDLLKGLSETERRKLDNFLQRMKGLHALFPGEVRGQWTFPNLLLRYYLFLESQGEEKGRARSPNAHGP